jgi:hypothetical protein
MSVPLVATPGALLAGFQFPKISWAFDTAAQEWIYTASNANALNPVSAGSDGGYTWGTTSWTSASSVNNTAAGYQFVSLTPVILPAG